MHWEQIKEKALLEIRYLKTGDKNLIKQINEISEQQVAEMSPKIFIDNHPDNCLNKIEATFENLCTTLEEMGVTSPKKLTVFEFYSKIRYFKQKKKS